MGVNKLATSLVILAALAAVNAQSLEDACTISGGVWSNCASACPTTCDNFLNPPLFCIQVCVTGCVCSSGTVLDPNTGSCVAPSNCGGALASPPPETMAVTEEICEFSGGQWSSCASLCPPTCENKEPLFCPLVCVTGCTCPPGQVLDPVYGCKDQSFCEITFCCLALTSACLACAAGVPEDLYCFVNPGTFGCPKPDPCDNVDCGPDAVCETVVNPCFVSPCPQSTICVPVASPPIDPCATILCEVGSNCQVFKSDCTGLENCPPVGQCVCNEIIPGDANTDGLVQISDIVILIENVVNTSNLPECIFNALDVVNDGVLTVADVILVVETIIG